MTTKSTVEKAAYVCEQAKELAQVSREADLYVLAYRLELVVMEAESLLGKRDHA